MEPIPRPRAVPDEMDVVSVGYTPVKGTRHLMRTAPVFDGTGPVDDRRFCLVDAERHRVLRTVEHPSLIAVVARLQAGGVLEVTLPDGRTVREAPTPSGVTLACDYWGRSVGLTLLDGPHAALLSSWLGRPVRLAAAPRGGVVYGAPISLVATASLRDLGERAGHPDLVAQASRFRATFLVETARPYEEEAWQGEEVRLAGLTVRIGEPIPRCALIDVHPCTGRRDAHLLKSLAGYRRGDPDGAPPFGVYGHVVAAPARTDLGPGPVQPSRCPG